MNSQDLLFDASAVLMLVRERGGEAPDILRTGSALALTYYEIGNALWRESFLLKRIDPEEALVLLKSVFRILETMNMASLQDEESGCAILTTAGKLKITYYDSAYITEARKSGKILVTDDEKLSRAAGDLGVKAMTSKMLGR